jgi:hypothetical protein
MLKIKRMGYGNGISSVGVLLLYFCCASASLYSQDKVRVLVSDSSSWEIRGGIGASHNGLGGHLNGGARPQTAEIIKTFRERCPLVTITNAREKVDFVVLLDHEGGKNLILRDNKVVVYNKEGDVIHSGSTRSLGNAVKDACSAIVSQPKSNP